jgi:hypothetical protein
VKPATKAVSVVTSMLATALVASPASACWRDWDWTRRVVGVASDGGFVTTDRSFSMDAESDGNTIRVHDRSGVEVERFEMEPHETSWIHGGTGRTPRPELAALDLDGLDLAHATAAVTAAMKTTPLRPSTTRFRHVRSGVRCGSIERETPSGFVRIADVGEHVISRPKCHPVTAKGYEHPSSELEFVHTRWSYDLPTPVGEQRGEHASEDVVTFYPKRRIEGLELALRGERALNAGKATEALPMLERSIALVPEYVPSRRALVWAAARTKTRWTRLKATLDVAIPKGTTCVAWAERDTLMDIPLEWLPWAEADTLASGDVVWPWDACREDASRFETVNARGDGVY